MNTYKELFIWWIGVLLIGTGIYWSHYNGFILAILSQDITHLTTLISSLFFAHIIYLGKISWDITKIKKKDELISLDAGDVRDHFKNIWFMSEIFLALGILGTVLGIINMTAIVPTSSSPEAITQYLAQMWPALSVAFYPNAVGLIASISTKVLSHYISRDINNKWL